MEEMVCDTDVSSEFGGVRGLCDGGVQPGRSSLSDPAPLQSQTCRGLWVKQHNYALGPVLTNVEFIFIIEIKSKDRRKRSSLTLARSENQGTVC